MRQILLYIMLFVSTCVFAQQASSVINQGNPSAVQANFLDADPEIEIFPNPTSDFINIKDPAGVVSTVSFFNLLGKEVVTHTLSDAKTFDLLGFQNGIYLMQLKDTRGQIIQTVRIRKI